jgi:hypothetical protein
MNKRIILGSGILVAALLVFFFWKRPTPPDTQSRVETMPDTPILVEQEPAVDPVAETPPAPLAPPVILPPSESKFDSAIAQKWLTEEGYTAQDIAEAQALMRREGIPEDRINDPDLVRRNLLPRVVTSVQISQLVVPEKAAAGAPIRFLLKGAVPAPEFNFVRFDIIRQGEVIRIRALGHSPAFADDPDGSSPAMLPVSLEGEIDPLPPGNYRIIIPELGLGGTLPFTVE